MSAILKSIDQAKEIKELTAVAAMLIDLAKDEDKLAEAERTFLHDLSKAIAEKSVERYTEVCWTFNAKVHKLNDEELASLLAMKSRLK